MAAGTRTAPTINGTPTYKRVSVAYQGVNDDKGVSKSVLVAGGATSVQIEALVAAMVDLSTASAYQVTVADVYSGDRDKANATADGRPSIDDQITVRAKNVSVQNTRYLEIPAPRSEMFEPNAELLDGDDALFLALVTAWDAVKDSYNVEAITFTERSERNVIQLV